MFIELIDFFSVIVHLNYNSGGGVEFRNLDLLQTNFIEWDDSVEQKIIRIDDDTIFDFNVKWMEIF